MFGRRPSAALPDEGPGDGLGPAPPLDSTGDPRLDLRGQTLRSRALRSVVPRAELDVEHAVEQVRPLCEDVRGPRRRRPARAHRAVRRRPARRHPGPGRRAGRRARGARRRCARRRWRSRSAGPGSCTASSVPTDVTTQSSPGGTVTERWVPVGRVGLYVPGGLAVYPSSVVDERGPARRPVSGRSPSRRRRSARTRRASRACPTRRSWRPARCSASRRSTPSAARRRSRCSPTARRRGRASWSASPSTSSPAGQHLRRRRQAAAQGRDRHRLRGRPDRDRHPGRRLGRPRARRRRPRSARPSTTRWPRPCW